LQLVSQNAANLMKSCDQLHIWCLFHFISFDTPQILI